MSVTPDVVRSFTFEEPGAPRGLPQASMMWPYCVRRRRSLSIDATTKRVEARPFKGTAARHMMMRNATSKQLLTLQTV